MCKDLKNRRGKITVSTEFIFTCSELLFKMFGKFIPLHCDGNVYTEQVFYYGVSLEFDVIEINASAPEYVFNGTLFRKV